MYCRGCGVHAPDDANFCVSCGADLRDFEDDRPEGSDPARDDTLDDLPVVDGAAAGHDETRVVPTTGVSAEAETAEELSDCPACGAPNSPNRYLCGRCGADLHTGENDRRIEVVPNPTAGVTPRGRAPRDDAGERGTNRRWRIAAAIVTAGVVIGAALGAMVAFELGPFANASDAAGDGPVFDRSAYPDRPEPLPVSSVATSTAQPGTSGRFDPAQLADGDATTAWNSRGEVNPDGVGEIIEVEFEAPVWLSQIVFANGDQQDDGSFVANARAKRLEVRADGGSSFIVNLLDERGEQAVRLPVPRLATSVRFEILEAYPGDTYDDLGMSELSFRGFVANTEDAAAARADDG